MSVQGRVLANFWDSETSSINFSFNVVVVQHLNMQAAMVGLQGICPAPPPLRLDGSVKGYNGEHSDLR